MAFSTQSGLPQCYESYEGEDFGCQDQGQLVRPCPPMPTHVFPVFPVLFQGKRFTVTCKANTDVTLGVRYSQVLMVHHDPKDSFQKWIKVYSWGKNKNVKDSVGHPVFCLVHRTTGKVLWHGSKAGDQVRLIKYDERGSDDKSLMWSESDDMGEGFKTIRMPDNTRLTMKWVHGDIKEENKVVLSEFNGQDNQLWKFNGQDDHLWKFNLVKS